MLDRNEIKKTAVMDHTIILKRGYPLCSEDNTAQSFVRGHRTDQTSFSI